jgi:hypothetical protein
MTLRRPYGYGTSGQELLEVSDGQRPALEGKRPSKNLPIKYVDEAQDGVGVVLTAGQIVSLESEQFVHANGGDAVALTYTALDIGKVLDLDTSDYVAGAKTTTAVLPANKPVGWLPMHVYDANIEDLNINYSIQPHVNILCDYLIEMAVKDKNDASGVLAVGDLVKSNANGEYIQYDDASSEPSQICGRVISRSSIDADKGLALVQTVNGLGLSGSGTGGIQKHLNVEKSVGVAATDKVLIQITLL